MRPRCGAGTLSINIEPGKTRCRRSDPSTLPFLWPLVGSLGLPTGELPTTAERKVAQPWAMECKVRVPALDSGWRGEEPRSCTNSLPRLVPAPGVRVLSLTLIVACSGDRTPISLAFRLAAPSLPPCLLCSPGRPCWIEGWEDGRQDGLWAGTTIRRHPRLSCELLLIHATRLCSQTVRHHHTCCTSMEWTLVCFFGKS